MITDLLSERAVSTYPLSIGTSLAMEALAPGKLPAYDPQFKPGGQVKPDEYSTAWVNLATLHRNIIGAVDGKYAEALKPMDIAVVLSQEVDLIREIFTSHCPGISVRFYICGYIAIQPRYPYAKMRADKTPKQIANTLLLKNTIEALFGSHEGEVDQIDDAQEQAAGELPSSKKYTYYPKLMKPAMSMQLHKKHLLMSHYAIDLMCLSQKHEVELLESHTGAVKGKALWYTKLSEAKDLPQIPFNAMTLQVFGDSQTFHPMAKNVRQEVIDLAQKYQWNAATTKARMRLNLGYMNDKLTAEILKTML